MDGPHSRSPAPGQPRWLDQRNGHGSVPSVRGRTETTRMILLVLALGGVQICWGLMMTYAMPYLLSLGLAKSGVSLVWLAGPLSGLIVAPVVGAVADHSTSRYGRRRPFILVGSLAVSMWMVTLAWAPEIVRVVIAGEQMTWALALAVCSIYGINFSINAVMWAARAIIVDTLPASKQQAGSAWASRMTATGNLAGYVVGSLDLTVMFGSSLGTSPLKQLTILASCALVGSCSTTCYAVTERVLIPSEGSKISPRHQAVAAMSQLIRAARYMPVGIRGICYAQFWSWIGWYPFLFYGPTWIGEVYFTYDAPALESGAVPDQSGEIGRIASRALTAFAAITLLASFVVPMLVQPRDGGKDAHSHQLPSSITKLSRGGDFLTNKPSLPSAWAMAHILFACIMVFAPLVTSYRFAATLITFCAIPWAVAQWAPHALLGEEVSKLGATFRSNLALGTSNSTSSALEADRDNRGHLSHHEDQEEDKERGYEDGEGGANIPSGVYLGILNLFTASPQIIGTLISTVVFRFYETRTRVQKNSEGNEQGAITTGPESIAVCLFIGACSMLVAAKIARGLR